MTGGGGGGRGGENGTRSSSTWRLSTCNQNMLASLSLFGHQGKACAAESVAVTQIEV